MIVLNISTLQIEKSWFLANSLFHCSFKTSVGTATNTTMLGLCLYNDLITIILLFVLPVPVAHSSTPLPPLSIQRLIPNF